MEPASTGLQGLIDDLKSIMMWIFTPEKLSDCTNEDFVLFPRELLADIGQHADESDRTTQGQILIFLYLLICEPVSKAFKSLLSLSFPIYKLAHLPLQDCCKD